MCYHLVHQAFVSCVIDSRKKFTLTDCCKDFSVSRFLCLKDSIIDIIKQAALQKGICEHEEVVNVVP